MNSLNKILLCKKFWISLSIVMIGIYLYPLFSGHLHIPVYDNLDSNVVWNKILANSNKIFTSNNTIIPNMMNGIPRASYGSEFDILLWLYCFFEPQTAFIINELLIHIVAFIGSYLLLSKYIVPKNKYYSYIIIYTGSIYFTTLPFWSGSGISISSLPLTTYILLDIKNRIDTKWHWFYLLVLPLYSSLVFLYMFYILYAGIYWLYDAIRHKHIDWRFFSAVFLLGSIFLLKEYRLVYAMFIDNGFVSHRTEFNVFFQENAWEVYRLIYVKFLQGHMPHAAGLQQIYILPLTLIAILLGFLRKKLTSKESLLIWCLIAISFALDIWTRLLQNRYTIPAIVIISIIAIYKHKQIHYKLAYTILGIITISTIATLFQYKGFAYITEYIPLLKELNVIRLYFIEPLLLLILLGFTLIIYMRRLSYTPIFILVFIVFQFIFSLSQSFYKLTLNGNYLSFNEYYAPKVFSNIKKDIKNIYPNKDFSQIKVVSYGIEPAVALYNNLYTVDGYSTNYPLSYKKSFRKVQTKLFSVPLLKSTAKLYDNWGSKLYLFGITSMPSTYNLYKQSNTPIPATRFNANTKELCKLNTNFIISAYPLKNIKEQNIKLINTYKGTFWNIWLYHINCNLYPKSH